MANDKNDYNLTGSKSFNCDEIFTNGQKWAFWRPVSLRLEEISIEIAKLDWNVLELESFM